VSRIRLIQIDRSGLPAEDIGPLPEVAQQCCAQTIELYQRVGFHPPWVGFLVLQDGNTVGTCAFTAPPRENRVEIAYFTFPEFEGRGIATAMARELIVMARAAWPAITITAHTLPQRNASNSILEKLGFEFFATIEHSEDGKVWAWHLAPN
jgi:ribosomal-protein-alanine N-acetyltransferase